MASTYIERLCLDETFNDAPQFKNLVTVFQEDTDKWRSYIQEYHASCQRLCNAHSEVFEATKNLFTTVSKIEFINFPLNHDGGMLKATMAQFGALLSELNTIQRTVASELNDQLLKPVNRILTKDFEASSSLCRRLQVASEERDNSLHNYMRLSTRCNDTQLADASADLEQMQRKRHGLALQYCSSLNLLQLRCKESLLMSVVKGVSAWKSGSKLISLPFAKHQTEQFIKNAAATCDEIGQAVGEESHQSDQLANYLKTECASFYSPLVAQQILMPHVNLDYKGDYLCMKQKTSGLLSQSKWILAYFFTQAGNLMKQDKDQVAGSVLVDLNEEGVCVEPIQSDERRNLFQINVPKERRYVILQCVNEKERREWVATINNIIREGGFIRRPSTSCDDASSDSASMTYADILPPDQINSWLVSQPIQFDLAPINFQECPSGSPNSSEERYSRRSKVSASVELGEELLEDHDNQSKPGPPDMKENQEEDPGGDIQLRIKSKHIDSFSMRFIGCVKVPSPAGEELISSVIRHVMKTRASHDIFRMSEVECNISTSQLTLSTALEANSPITVVNVPIKKLTCTSVHKDNARLFGFIAGPYDASSAGVNSPSSHSGRYICYAFECEDGNQISRAVRTAKRQADPQKKRETALLLESIMRLPDMSLSSPLPDAQQSKSRLAHKMSSIDSNVDVFDENDKPYNRPDEADGDERSVEGAENSSAI